MATLRGYLAHWNGLRPLGKSIHHGQQVGHPLAPILVLWQWAHQVDIDQAPGLSLQRAVEHVLVFTDCVQLLDAVDAVGDFLYNPTACPWHVETLPEFPLGSRDPEVPGGGLLVGPLEDFLEILAQQTHLPSYSVVVDKPLVRIDPQPPEQAVVRLQVGISLQ